MHCIERGDDTEYNELGKHAGFMTQCQIESSRIYTAIVTRCSFRLDSRVVPDDPAAKVTVAGPPAPSRIADNYAQRGRCTRSNHEPPISLGPDHARVRIRPRCPAMNHEKPSFEVVNLADPSRPDSMNQTVSAIVMRLRTDRTGVRGPAVRWLGRRFARGAIIPTALHIAPPFASGIAVPMYV